MGQQVNIIAQRHYIRLISGSVLLLALTALAPPLLARSLAASDLSAWLNDDVVPELSELLSRHPRFLGQRMHIVGGDNNALSEDIAIALNNNLVGQGGIALTPPGEVGPASRTTGSIDELGCFNAPEFDYLLQVTSHSSANGSDRVDLTLIDISSSAEQINRWQWQGSFSSAQRRQFEQSVVSANGSLNAPWRDQDVEAAAAALSRDFACALRPQIHERLGLLWVDAPGLPGLFADTANATRHILGDYRELGISEVQPDYAVAIHTEQFRDDIWQLWLTGTPRDQALAPVQAVTYFKSASVDASSHGVAAATEGARQSASGNAPGPALEFIDVQMLDATQADKGRSRAELQVTLRISNRAQLPIAYSFTLSGGHFEQCIAAPRYYRHDDYGLLTGELEAGASVLRRLVIENAQHRPTPLYGVPKCAGFRDLQGFEDFASQGYRVTEYVRWAM